LAQQESTAAAVAAGFSHKRLPFGTSLARQIARQHLSNFNNVFWVSHHSFRLIRQSFSDLNIPAPGPGIHGSFTAEGEWEKGADELRIWTRQHILISAASLLEVYVLSAATAALSATPELIDKSLTGVDGIRFIKHPESTPAYLKGIIETRVDGFTHGLWRDRLLRMSLIFGALPGDLLSLSRELQTLQDRRNRIAHSYGIGGELRKTPWEPLQAITVTPAQIIAAIKVVSAAIRLLDERVFATQIGAFEILHEFDIWTKRNKNAGRWRVSGRLPLEFRLHIGRAFGQTPGMKYIKGMVRYYDSLPK
jgi:hypothetical protein